MSLGTLEREATVAAAAGRATHVEHGQLLKVIDVEGGQIADLFFFNPSDPADFFSPAHTRVALEQHNLVVGEPIHNNKRQPIATVEEDTVGVHDMLLPACSPHQYIREYGSADHASCRANLFQALGEYFLRPVVVPDASISAIARRVPSRTKSASTHAPSTGQIVFSSHVSKGSDSPSPRSSVIAKWPWALTSPGMTTC